MPQWGRSYLCPVCGASLTPEARRSRRPPAWLLYGLGALLLGGAIARVAADRLTRRPTGPTPMAFEMPAAPVIPPRDLQQRLEARYRFMAAELELAPTSALHLRQAAEAALSAAFLHQEEGNDQAAGRWYERARNLARRLQAHNPGAATALLNRVNAPRSLRWREAGESAPGTLTPSLSLSRPMAAVSAMNGPGNVPAPLPPGNIPTPGLQPTLVPEAPPGFGTLQPPGSRTEVVMVPPRVERPSLDELRAAFRARPGDPETVDALGQALEDAVRPGRLIPESVPLLEEAIRVYRQGAARTRLRLHRATFLLAASQLLERLTRYEEQRALLIQATRAYPYSSQVWRQLSGACLRLGLQEESRRADREARRWRLPSVGFG
jgi:tetratricopeptide (TPR) repeat protein